MFTVVFIASSVSEKAAKLTTYEALSIVAKRRENLQKKYKIENPGGPQSIMKEWCPREGLEA